MIRILTLHGTHSFLSRDRIAQVQDLFRTSFPDLEDFADRIPEQLRDPLGHGFKSALLVAEGALGRVDAFALVLQFASTRFSFLDYTASRPDMRGRGIGGALYEAVREYAIASGSRCLFLEVQPDDPEFNEDPKMLEMARKRVRFYERYGARVVANIGYHEPVGEPPTRAYLVYDGLGSDAPLDRTYARLAVEQILARRFRHATNPGYVEQVLDSFVDDPVPLRPARYTKKIELPPVPPLSRLGRRFALVENPRHSLHHIKSRGYFERPARAETLSKSIRRLGLFEDVAPRRHSEASILAVHDRKFVRFLQEVSASIESERPVYPDTFVIRGTSRRPRNLPVQAGYYCLDSGTPLYRQAWTAARAAVDTALTAAGEVLAGRPLAYALCRPPGHHAGPDYYGGFCYLNNAAIAAQHLVAHGKVAILDLDYHHGNGTQDVFYERDDVLTVSIHGHPDQAYPYFSGFADETGRGTGLGANLNLPLRPGTGPETYLETLDKALTAVRKFGAELLVVGLGFDILRLDPTGLFDLPATTMQQIGARLAAEGLPVLVVQEGGYNLRNIERGSAYWFSGFATALAESSG